MAENSNIEWTDHTFNPWIGCAKVSPGCEHCYAASQDAFRKWTPEGWGPGKPRRRTSVANWNKVRAWNEIAGKAGIRPRVFCASLADWLDDEVPIEWLADLLDLIRLTPNLDWLLLTKRPQNWQKRIEAVLALGCPAGGEPSWWYLAQCWSCGVPPANVWIGTTVEDQKRADERIPVLLSIPARIRFLSCEPLLGPVGLVLSRSVALGLTEYHNVITGNRSDYSSIYGGGEPSLDIPATDPRIHWVIVGGESGPGARPMHPKWALALRNQCYQSDVAFFFKQWGEWLPDAQRHYTTSGTITWGRIGLDGDFRLCLENGKRIPGSDVSWRHGEEGTIRVGKKTAGRILDGTLHDAIPR